MKPGWIIAGVAAALLVKVTCFGQEFRLISFGVPKPKREIPREINENALLWAIAERETGNKPGQVGRIYGERSRYQFTRETWALHGHEPFEWATTRPELADARAARHLSYIRAVLRQRGIEESVRHIAAAWHFGPGFAKVCAASAYADEVVNLYNEEVQQ